MVSFQNFKILPLLIMVAVLAFSVRLAEVFTGFSSLSGSAHAVEEVAAEPPPMPAMNDEIGDMKAGEKPEKAKEPVLVFTEDEEETEDGHGKEEPQEKEDVDTPVDWRDASDSDLDYSEVKMELFKDLSKRRREIEKREQEVLTREALLQAAEKELDRKYQELLQLRSEIEGLLTQQSEEEEERITSLVKIYEGMKPKDAARIFDTLDLDILVAVMGKMSERKLGPILAKMNPERARTVTIMLAEQKQLPDLPESN